MERQLGEEYIALEARREDRLQKNEEICSVHRHIERSRKTESENVPRYDKLEVAGDLKWKQLAAGAEIISHIIEQMDKALSQCHKGQTPGSWSLDIGFRKKEKLGKTVYLAITTSSKNTSLPIYLHIMPC